MESPFYETQLYAPVKKYFTTLGFTVNGEVKGCDMTAIKDGLLVIIELKKQINIKLLYQVTQRQKITDDVYVAVPRPKLKKGTDWDERVSVLKRLSAGLITVSVDSPVPVAEVVFHPCSARIYSNKRKKGLIEKEISKRSADFNVGGATKIKLVTAYREQAIKLACLLYNATATLADLRILMDNPKIEYMLRRNQYNWFERCGRAVYRLSEEGYRFFNNVPPEFSEVVNHYAKQFECEISKGAYFDANKMGYIGSKLDS